uniref:Muscle-restricted coiled-coil protein n=1 Tax=Cynoglossus semilaevis TaxID=244447 RepID=A0A3P8V8T1_CYNSE
MKQEQIDVKHLGPALTILSLLERVAGIIDNVQSGQQRMEERQLELENSIKNVQGDVLKLAKDHSDTSGTVEKLLQKTRKVSANVKEVRTRVEKQNVRVKKVESTQDELLTRNKFRVIIYQVSRSLGQCSRPSSRKAQGLSGTCCQTLLKFTESLEPPLKLINLPKV